MIVKLDDDVLINMDHVNTIMIRENETCEYELVVRFERGDEFSLFYSKEKEALEALNELPFASCTPSALL